MEKKQTYILLVVAALVAIGVSVMIVLGSNKSESGDKGDQTTGTGEPLQGLQENPAPFQPEYANLAQRIKSLGIPLPGKETYHIHARIGIYIDGQPQVISSNIGVDTRTRTVSAIHSHDAEGIIHMEADQPFETKLSDYFGIWGVKFTNEQLGVYKNTPEKQLQVYVEGKKIDDPVNYVVKAKERIIVGYGAPGSFPTAPQQEFPTGL